MSSTTDAVHAHLRKLLEHAASTTPDRVAVEEEAGRQTTYGELAHQAERLAARLARWGIGPGDRVGLFLPKSSESIAAIHAILRQGAAYVPVDPTAPARRGAGILSSASVRAVIVHASLAPALIESWEAPGPRPRLIVVGGIPDRHETRFEQVCWNEVQADSSPTPRPGPGNTNHLAYILYTSGSTGTPKGVMLSHRNAFCFLDWCQQYLHPRDGERFSSHAPLHFDLSIFDLFVCCRNRGTLVIVGETLSKEPARLAAFIHERKIDVWYSAPSILGLMAEQERLATGPGAHAPRLVLFAGEVFPIRGLKSLRAAWPAAELWNLYGPTETNVCTAMPIPQTIGDEQATPFPIGHVCPPLMARVVDEAGQPVEPGAAGELQIAGPGVMRGYFGRPDLDELVFQTDNAGTTWYRTGDLVVASSDQCFTFHGRRDRMVKKRGYRIELGEIESALYQHTDVERAAVVAHSDDSGVSIDAFVSVKPERKASIIAMKRHCTLFLPHYMVPDRIRFLPSLPMTSTDKVDYQSLRRLNEPIATPEKQG